MCRTQRNLQVNLIHPDLGLGGAERLIIDIATATVVAGHKVSIYTAHHDKSHCFSDTLTKDGGRVHWIHLHATWLPRNILGRFHAICANFRCLWLVVSSIHARHWFNLKISCKDCGPVEGLRLSRRLDFGPGSTTHCRPQLFRSEDNILLSFSWLSACTL